MKETKVFHSHKSRNYLHEKIQKNLPKKKKKLLKSVNLARSPDPRSVYRNQLYFYILSVNSWTLKFRKIIIIVSEVMKYLNINLTKYEQQHLLNDETKKLMKDKLDP